MTTSWARSRTPSLDIARLTCVLTVSGDRYSRPAMSVLLSPSATRDTISLSRSVSTSRETGRRPGAPSCGWGRERAMRLRGGAAGGAERGQRVAACHDPDGVQQLLRFHALAEEAARPRPQRSEYVLVDLERGQDGAPAGGQLRSPGDGLRRGEAVHPGHADVHEDDVRTQFGGQPHRLGTVAGLPHHLDVRGAAEERGETRGDEPLGLSEQNLQGHVRSSRGIW